VGDVDDVLAASDDQLEDRLAQQLACGGDRDGAEPGDLTGLAVLGDARVFAFR
jgi:hypothetical protein